MKGISLHAKTYNTLMLKEKPTKQFEFNLSIGR